MSTPPPPQKKSHYEKRGFRNGLREAKVARFMNSKIHISVEIKLVKNRVVEIRFNKKWLALQESVNSCCCWTGHITQARQPCSKQEASLWVGNVHLQLMASEHTSTSECHEFKHLIRCKLISFKEGKKREKGKHFLI